jgi:DNA repair photolyase
VQRLNAAGVPTGVLLAPILPGITDSEASLEAVMSAAAAHGAVTFGSTALRLAPGVRDHYLRFVGEMRPTLLPRYERAYTGPYAPPDYLTRLTARVDRLRERYGFAGDAMQRRDLVPRPAAPAAAPLPAGGAQLELPLA